MWRIVPAWITSDERRQALDELARLVDDGGLCFEPGRQRSGYERAPIPSAMTMTTTTTTTTTTTLWTTLLTRALRILGNPPAWDAWILRYPPGSLIPAHRDPAPMDGFAHVRLNAVLDDGAMAAAPSSPGGIFSADGVAVPLTLGDAIIFRPDVVTHAVSEVRGHRLVFSVGTAWPLAEVASRAFGISSQSPASDNEDW